MRTPDGQGLESRGFESTTHPNRPLEAVQQTILLRLRYRSAAMPRGELNFTIKSAKSMQLRG